MRVGVSSQRSRMTVEIGVLRLSVSKEEKT